MLLASEGDEFGQRIGDRLEGCKCHLHGKHLHCDKVLCVIVKEPHLEKMSAHRYCSLFSQFLVILLTTVDSTCTAFVLLLTLYLIRVCLWCLQNGRRHLTSSINEVSRDLVVNTDSKKKQALMVNPLL